jgi:hypothetical protein
MKRIIFAFLIGGFLGTGVGFIVGIFVYPFVFQADIVAQEALPDRTAQTLVASGRFVHANPSDPLHYGKGDVQVYDDLVRLGEHFEVGPGPKFHVYLVPLDDVTPDTEIEKTMYVDLGRLRAFKGSQNYRIPPGLDLSAYKYVVIWCEHFSVLISPAKLSKAS